MYDTENEALYQDTYNSKENNEPKQHLHGQSYTVHQSHFFMSCLHYTEQSINRLLDIWGLCYVWNRDEEVIWSNPIPGRQLHRHLIICLQI